MWRACDEARAALPSIAAPRAESIGYVEAGETLPVYRISIPDETAESLANRALVIACVLADDDVHATTALLDWAEEALVTDHIAADDSLFVPQLHAEFSRDDRAPTLTITGAPAEVGETLTHGGAAHVIMEEALEALSEAEVTGGREFELGFFGETFSEDPNGEPQRDAYFASFQPRLAGVGLVGGGAEVFVRPDGALISIELALVQTESAGTTTAAMSEDEVDVRYRELAAAKYPNAEVVQPGSGGTAYFVPKAGDGGEVEPVWSARFRVELENGDVGPEERHTLSLTDPNALLRLEE